MRMMILAAASLALLSGCTSAPRPLVPDTVQGPTSYVCYSTALSDPTEVREIAARQCGRWGLQVTGLLGQSWTPLRCGFLTPTVAAFQCGQ